MKLNKLKLFQFKKTPVDLEEKNNNLIVTISDINKFNDYFSVEDFDVAKIHYYTTIRRVRIGAEMYTTDFEERSESHGKQYGFTVVKPNINYGAKNVIFDLMDITDVVSSKSKMIKLSIFNEMIKQIEEFTIERKINNVSFMYVLNSEVDYNDSILKLLLLNNKNNKDISFPFDLYFIVKDITGTLSIVKVAEKDAPYNETKIISSFKRYSLSSNTIKFFKDSMNNEAKIEDELGLAKDKKEDIEIISNGANNVQSKSIEKAIKDNIIKQDDLDINKKSEILLKSLSNALADENTIKDTVKYDEALLNKVISKMKKENIEDFVSEMKSLTFTPSKLSEESQFDDGFKDNKVLTNSATEFRVQYNKKVLMKDIKNVLNSLGNHPVYPLILESVEHEDVKTTTDYTRIVKATFKDNKGKTVPMEIHTPLLMENNMTYIVDGSRYILYNQLVAKPILKVKPDTVAVTTNFNKWFIYRFGESNTHSKFNKIIRCIDNLPKDSGISIVSNENEKLRFSTFELDVISERFPKIIFDDSNTVITLRQDKYFDGLHSKFVSRQPKFKDDYITIGSKGDNITLLIDKVTMVYTYNEKSNDLVSTNKILTDFLIDLLPDSILKKPNRQTFTRINVVGQKIPLILMLMSKYSLKTIFKEYNVSFEVFDSNEKVRETNENIRLKLADGIILIDINTSEKQLLLNGLNKIKDIEKYTLEDLFKKNENEIVRETLGANVVKGCISSLDNMIDPITESILRQELLPTDILNVCLYANTLLRDSSFKKPSDMSGYRLRGEETIPAMMYRFLKNEQTKFAEMYKRNPRLNMSVNKQQLKMDFINTLPNFSNYSSANQYMEMNEREKVVFSGFLGLNNSDSLTLELRSPDATQEGIIDVNAIVDSSKAGAIKYGTMNIGIKNLRGNFTFDKKDDFSTKLSYSGSSEPFIASRADSSRVAMNSIQQRHFLPLSGFYDSPLVRTGTEDIAKHSLSDDFVIKSNVTGKIVAIDDKKKFITIHNEKTNKLDYISFKEKNLKNGGAGFSHRNEYDLQENIKVNSKIKDGDIVALNNGVFSNNVISNGKLLKVCLAPHPNLLEDASLLSDRIAKKAVMKYVDEKDNTFSALTTQILSINKFIGQKVTIGETIIKFTSKNDEIESTVGLNLTDDLFEDAYQSIDSKVNGTITNIKVYYNTGEENLSVPVQNLIKSLNKLDKEEKTHILDQRVIKTNDNMILGMRRTNAIVIRIFTEEDREGKTGSKLTMQSTKSVYAVKNDDLMPRTLDNKPIDLQISSLSLITRMVPEL